MEPAGGAGQTAGASRQSLQPALVLGRPAGLTLSSGGPVAKRTGALLVGSSSTCQFGRAAGVAYINSIANIAGFGCTGNDAVSNMTASPQRTLPSFEV